MSVQSYTGCQNTTCPITHKSFLEIENPVVIQWNLNQLYEYAALAQWLRVSRSSRDPMTNLRIDSDSIMDVGIPLRGYSTFETVHTIFGDLIGKKQSFRMAWGGVDSSFHYMAGTLFNIVGVAKLSVNVIIITPSPTLQLSLRKISATIGLPYL